MSTGARVGSKGSDSIITAGVCVYVCVCVCVVWCGVV